MVSDYVDQQPDFFAVGPAAAPAAIDQGAGIWCSPGLSNAYLIVTDAGRIVVNTGMWFEARTHRANFDAVSDTPIEYLILTQSHTDHLGGVELFREPGTTFVAQCSNAACQDDDHRIHAFRIRRSLPFFAAVMGRPDYLRGDEVDIPSEPPYVTPDLCFHEEYSFQLGGRRFELISVSGGETIDSLVVWLPDERIALVGNMFSALFGHVPNLVTVRGDKLRFALAFVDSVQRVIDLEPETLLLGHHGPVRGAATVRAELERIRASVQWMHDATVEAMNRGDDVWTTMRTLRFPDELELGQGYGRLDWSVRAIWEGYGGWFHQRSTLELYPVAPEHGWAEMVALAGGTDAVAARAAALVDEGDALTAVRLSEMALAVDPDHAEALRVYRAAHEALLAEHGGKNFWLTRWLEGECASATNRLAATGDA
ncbi:MAG TPA: alkyl sulfatase dimerization domain-containing protein [Acidimicrobiia bacterium]|nr:alkyl sulfatase dimerization domain-containing protein [Acidimicrobiia bacterium]